MRIGRMRTRLEVQKGNIISDPDYGTPRPANWSFFRKIWAERVQSSGLEQVTASAVVGKEVAKWRTRYRDDITPQMRIVTKKGVYDIHAIDPEDHQNQFMLITAVRGLTSGQ